MALDICALFEVNAISFAKRLGKLALHLRTEKGRENCEKGNGSISRFESGI